MRERELKRVRIIEVEYQSDTRTTSEHEKIETKPCRSPPQKKSENRKNIEENNVKESIGKKNGERKYKGETQKEPNRTRTTKKYVVKCN